MFENLVNFILLRPSRAKSAGRKYLKIIESELAEDFLKLLLNAMKLYFYISKSFRKNIEDFKGRYLFTSRDGRITVAAVFDRGRMQVTEKEIEGPNVKITFRDARTLRNFLLSPKADILGSLLGQDLVPSGNLNYLYKFAYMAKHLQLEFMG